jgi:hypothetical protein
LSALRNRDEIYKLRGLPTGHRNGASAGAPAASAA